MDKKLLTYSLSWILSLGLLACSQSTNDIFPGYVEAEYVRLASALSGSLVKIDVQRGEMVQAGAAAFTLEQASERAEQQAAQFRVQQASAQLDNLRKGKRPDEIDSLRAQLARAQAALDLSSADYLRDKQLIAEQFISPARLDEAQAAVARDRAQVHELQAQLRLAQQGARVDELAAAQAQVQEAQAQFAQAQWKVAQKTQVIPQAAQVNDVLYRVGEWVPAGTPIVSLLPPDHIKARFFVPQKILGTLRLGQHVGLRCDACAATIEAKISYIAPEAEYTAPLIYSKENRAALVFMIEAKPMQIEQARQLHPGQPLEISLR